MKSHRSTFCIMSFQFYVCFSCVVSFQLAGIWASNHHFNFVEALMGGRPTMAFSDIEEGWLVAEYAQAQGCGIVAWAQEWENV